MFKFLRKYNKWILAVGGTLLMIVFLIPQAIEGLAQSAGTARATRATLVTPDGSSERVTLAEWELISAEYEFINRFARFGANPIPALGELQGPAHWYLLTREASMLGLIGPPGSIELSQEQLLQMNARRDVVERTIPKLEGVFRMLGLYQGAADVSDHRLKQYARRMLHEVEADVVVIHASADEVDLQPTDQQLREQMERFADDAPGQGEMGFGYRLPDRLKLEWLAIPAETVREAIRTSDKMDNVALRTHWARQLRDPQSTLPEIDPDDPVIPDVVREHLLEQLTKEQLEAIAKFASDQLRANRRGLAYRDGYAILPEDWNDRRLSFAVLTEEIQSRFVIDTPEYHATGDRWLEMSDLPTLDGIGAASTDRFGTTPRSLRRLVEGALEFGGSAIAPVQRGVAGPALRGPDDGVYLFRITEVDPARAPRSIDEVRDELVRDVRRQAHYEQLADQVDAIELSARQDGLLTLAVEYDASVDEAIISLVDFNARSDRPMPRPIPGLGANREVTETIIDRAIDLPVALNELPMQQRIFAMSVDSSLAVLVVRLNINRPLTTESYALNALDARALLLSEELGGGDHLREVFGFEALKGRYNFVLYSPSGDEQEELDDLEDILPIS